VPPNTLNKCPEAGWFEEVGEKMQYAVILEEGSESWGAYVIQPKI
jgi:hypothetical protein